MIIAGRFDGGDVFKLYSWSSNSQEKPEIIDSIQFPNDFRPESILFYPYLSDRFQILSDDGAVKRINNIPCKEIPNSNNPEKYFKSIWVKIDKF